MEVRYMKKNTYSGKAVQKRRRARRMRRFKFLSGSVAAVLCVLLFLAGKSKLFPETAKEGTENSQAAKELLQTGMSENAYPKELAELLEKNEETYDFVKGYANRVDYQGKAIDLSEEITKGQVPLLMQWDKRWGYDNYGSEMIAIAGCGPTCMTMAYLYLTEDAAMNPRQMAKFAAEQGYNSSAGTNWSFFTDGAEQLGLQGTEIPLSEDTIRQALDQGKVVICSMRPGDFTTTGHFIIICGYDKQGFLVNDPNSHKNSEKKWSYKTLSGQIKCLWAIGN